MAEPHDPSAEAVDPADEQLWSLLHRTVAERVPEEVRAAAHQAFAWRDPDARLAALVADSADPEREQVAPRPGCRPAPLVDLRLRRHVH